MPTVKELRESRGWTQPDLAVKAGVSVAVISRMENGKPIQKTSLLLVAHTLMVSVDQITGVNIVHRIKRT